MRTEKEGCPHPSPWNPDVFPQIWGSLDPTSQQQFYAVSKQIRDLATACIRQLVIRIPDDEVGARKTAQLGFLPPTTLSLMMGDLAIKLEAQNRNPGVAPLESGVLSAFIRALGQWPGGPLASRVHHLTISHAVLGEDVGKSLSAVNLAAGGRFSLELDSCVVNLQTHADPSMPFFSSAPLHQLDSLRVLSSLRPLRQEDLGAQELPLYVMTSPLPLSCLQQCTGINSLEIRQGGVSKLTGQTVEALKSWTCLRSLKLPDCTLKSGGVEAAIRHWTNLTHLEVSGLEYTTDMRTWYCPWREVVLHKEGVEVLAGLNLSGISYLQVGRESNRYLNTFNVDREATAEDVAILVDHLLTCPVPDMRLCLSLCHRQYDSNLLEVLRPLGQHVCAAHLLFYEDWLPHLDSCFGSSLQYLDMHLLLGDWGEEGSLAGRFPLLKVATLLVVGEVLVAYYPPDELHVLVGDMSRVLVGMRDHHPELQEVEVVVLANDPLSWGHIRHMRQHLAHWGQLVGPRVTLSLKTQPEHEGESMSQGWYMVREEEE